MALSKNQVKQATTPTPTTDAAATYASDAAEIEKQTKRGRQRRGEKLTLVSFACPPQLLADSRRLAHYRQQTHSSLLQQIVQEYVDANRAEIDRFDAVYQELGKPLPNPTE